MEKPTEYSLTWEVTDEMTAKRIGSAGSKILSTPNMVALMEAAALELAKAYLDEGMTTVGAEIHCRHLAPTPVGMKVTATARLRSMADQIDQAGLSASGAADNADRFTGFDMQVNILQSILTGPVFIGKAHMVKINASVRHFHDRILRIVEFRLLIEHF